MVANYPYFGLPNYMNYMNPSVLKNVPPPKQEFSKAQAPFQAQNNFQNESAIYTNPYYFNRNQGYSRISTNKNSFANNTYNYGQINTNKHSSDFKTTTHNRQINSSYNYKTGDHSAYFKITTDDRQMHNNSYNSNFQPNVLKPPKKEKAKKQEPPLFSFLGINLYFDDVLILCILFFLYNEQVNDPYLFFILVLLLLT